MKKGVVLFSVLYSYLWQKEGGTWTRWDISTDTSASLWLCLVALQAGNIHSTEILKYFNSPLYDF